MMRGLKALVSAYEELSVMRIGRVRGRVLAARTFREGLFQVFSEVRISQHIQIRDLLVRQQHRSFLARLFSRLPGVAQPAAEAVEERRSAAVLLSSNQKLSGTITQSLFLRFLAHVDQEKPNAVAVSGAVGQEYLRRARPHLTFRSFPLPRDDAPLSEHRELVRYLRMFNDVRIFYGRFVNVVDQVAATTHLASEARLVSAASADMSVAHAAQQREEAKDRYYLFEPELPALLSFFDTQVFALLFHQTVSESSLALLGSRITAMERASANVDRRLSRLTLEALHARKREANRKQRQTLAGMSLWEV